MRLFNTTVHVRKEEFVPLEAGKGDACMCADLLYIT